nr:immunoglobulin light chain junction region [Macaca mulatta]MOW38179.1 immunoglobulin light chain junction region [Macaca mulatta]
DYYCQVDDSSAAVF